MDAFAIPLGPRRAPDPRIARGLGLGAAASVAFTLGAVAGCVLLLRIVPAYAQDVRPPEVSRGVAVPEAMATLRGDIVARADVITLGDVIANAPDALASRPLFRAPALGATGTIQSRRIVEAAADLGVGPVETGGRVQISVQRAARRIGVAEIEAAMKAALARRNGLDPKMLTINFDGELPQLLVPPDLTDPAAAPEISYDPRSRRVAALITVGARQASLRVTGTALETVEVAILSRALAKGATLREGDLTLERRPRDGLPGDAQVAGLPLAGQVAQRPLGAGTVVRSGDVAPPELVAKGEGVTIVFEAPGVSLALRGRATESGGLGDIVGVINPASKKTLQGTVVGPGRVSVGPVPGRVASAGQP